MFDVADIIHWLSLPSSSAAATAAFSSQQQQRVYVKSLIIYNMHRHSACFGLTRLQRPCGLPHSAAGI